MPAAGHISAWVQVNGIRLPEYGTTVSADGTEVSCWIPSEAGKNFEICYQDSLRAFATGTKLYIDGVRMRGKFLYPHSMTERRRSEHATHRGITVSPSEYKPYVFANCELIEDEDFLSTMSPHVGEIVCAVAELRLREFAPPPTATYEFPPLRVQERAKKGIVHGTQLGSAVKMSRSRRRRETDTIQQLVKFKFVYRPLNVLIADGIAPASASDVGVLAYLPHDNSEVIYFRDEEEVGLAMKREPKRERSMTFDNYSIDLTV
ncbi:hypothetical protein HYPSUDRAFT_48907 [Hypholoma sublateritium FD-334 SS-4]|uniref:DUF7918 domain-containing protein n=1 Tax=Hypholoma sublateritium (strain FD-334 SS-4) TaxID=945553 RepID=A0A0D2P2D9_HYPSF|nr:hypothetical protein HYPSUDRAFT_48907 [Hypholoma sublateritium FD-334 SS-4]